MSTQGFHDLNGGIDTQGVNVNQEVPRPYTYGYLHPGHMRLFRVVQLSDQITCDMRHFPLGNCPDYHTLSYAWGSGSFSHSIYFDGEQHLITEHLYQGIQSIVPLLSPNWLWIDQICINQTDSEDKASQVALMGDIYTNAVQTIVWLGPAYQKSDLAMSYVEGIAELIRAYNFDPTLMAQTPVELGFPHEDEQLWPAIQCLFKRLWWSRLWIIQEVIKTKDVVFVAGNSSASYHDFVTLASAHEKLIRVLPNETYKLGILTGVSKAFYCLRNEVLCAMDGLRSAGPVINEIEPHSGNVSKLLHNIIGVLELSRNQSCSVPVDRVYAILGLVSRQIRSKVKIDYSEENKEHYWRTYLHFHRYLISTFLDAGYVYTTVFVGQHTSSTPGSLPSWCPELVNPLPLARPSTTVSGAGHIPSSTTWKPDYRMLEPCESDSSILHVTGFRVDTIKTTIPLWSAPRPILFDKLKCSDATDIKKPLIACMALAETTRTSPDDWTWMDALFRTWVMNTRASSQDAYPAGTIGTDCLAFINRLTAIIDHRHNETPLNAIEVSAEATRYASAFFEYTRRRAMFLTEGGRLGLCDAVAKPGDEVVIWFNCVYPVVQRVLPGIGGCVPLDKSKPRSSDTLLGAVDSTVIGTPTWFPGKFPGERREQQHRRLIGLCYIDGMMQGEVFAERDIEKEGYSNFLIV